METGIGKTYVYLFTSLELFKSYGMRKPIIVVPSVAIREGVLKMLQVTEDHLRTLSRFPLQIKFPRILRIESGGLIAQLSRECSMRS